ncbi:hypothetical protein ABW19_dt0208980 [Dactylella cylindrospora]|nr:hypothetical protein ABW19_dt0208980 [Dactylella cylindrospora]
MSVSMASNSSQIDQKMGHNEVFHLLKTKFGLPLPPDEITEDEIGPEASDFFTQTKFLLTYGRRNLAAAIKEFERYYNIGNLSEETVTKAPSIRSSQRRQGAVQRRRIKAFNEELRKQLAIFQRDGGSIVTQNSSRVPSMNMDGPYRRQPTELSSSRGSEKHVRKVLDWRERNRSEFYTASPTALIQGDGVAPNLEEDFADVDTEQDPDNEIHDAFIEEPTEIDDSGLFPASSFATANMVQDRDSHPPLEFQFMAEINVSPSKLDGSVENSHKPAAMPGAFPNSTTSQSEVSPSAAKKASAGPAHPIVYSPPSKHVHQKNHNWGLYHPSDVIPPKPSFTKRPVRSPSSASHSTATDMDEEKKRKRPPRRRKEESEDQELSEPPSKRQSPDRKEAKDVIGIDIPGPKRTQSSAFEISTIAHPGTSNFKVPGLPRSFGKESRKDKAEQVSTATIAYPRLPVVEGESFSSVSTSRRTSFAFDEPPLIVTQPTSFNSTMEGKLNGTVEVAMEDEVTGEDFGRYDDVPEDMFPPIEIATVGSVSSSHKGRRPGSTASSHCSMNSRSITRTRRKDTNISQSRQVSPGAQLLRESMDKGYTSHGTYSIGESTEREFSKLDAPTTGPRPLVPKQLGKRKFSLYDHGSGELLPGDNIEFEDDTPFWLRYEITRIVLGTSAKRTIEEAIEKAQVLVEKLRTEGLSYDGISREIQAALGKYKPDETHTIGNLNRRAVEVLQRSWGSWNNHLQLSAEVKFEKIRKEGGHICRPTIRLKPLQTEALTNRFSEKFGSHRFMTLRIPAWDSTMGISEDDYWSIIETWLIEGGFPLLGRHWKAIYFRKETKKADKRRTKKTKPDKILLMFAESGHDIEPITVLQAFEWFLPIDENLKSFQCKVFSRLGLGFSPTTPTVTFDQLNIMVVSDIPGKSFGQILTDGCGLVSLAVLREIKQRLNLDRLPSVVQGRIGPAKGLWLADLSGADSDVIESDECWIQIRDSQKKFEITSEDIAHRTLNISKYSAPLGPARLNMQFLPILLRNGVSYNALADLLREDIQREFGEVFEKLDNPCYLKGYVERLKLNGSRRGADTIQTSGGIPRALAERVVMMLEAGFTLQRTATLRDWFKEILSDYCLEIKERMHITVQKSRMPFCVPDPSGILRDGEVYMRFSTPVIDEKTLLSMDILQGDILVGRNPAHCRSDIRKVKAIDVPELRHLTDVIVFSADQNTCNRSLASYLSGGDYDGDRVWTCWDPRLVKSFQNHEIEEISVGNYFRKDQSKMKERTMGNWKRDRMGAFQNFMNKHLRLALDDDLLGICTSYLEKTVYTEGIDHPLAKELAAICSKLVDAPKQGDQIYPDSWTEIIRKCKNYPEPLFKATGSLTAADIESGKQSSNPIDMLRFRVAHEEVERLMASFSEQMQEASPLDEDVTKLYYDVWDTFTQKMDELRSNPDKGAEFEAASSIIDQIKRLNRQLEDNIVEPWQQHFVHGGSNIDQGDERTQFRNDNLKDKLLDTYRKIQPDLDSITFPSDLIEDWARNGDDLFDRWSLLRAAALFRKANGRPVAWAMACWEICWMKLKAVSGNSSTLMRFSTEKMYLATKTRASVMSQPVSETWVFDGDDDSEDHDDDAELLDDI